MVMVFSTMVLVLPSATVWPSGSARLTSMTPSVPPAPPMFSTKTEPSTGFTRSAHCRPTMSFTPPAENGTTSLIGRLGKRGLRERAGAASAADAQGRVSERRGGSSELLQSLHLESEWS